MELSLTSFLIVCPLVFLAGFVDSIGGGGGLISLPAYLMAGLPPHIAVGTNKFSSSVGTLVATIRYCINGFADYKLAVPGVIASLLGAQIGARIALVVSGELFKIVLVILLPVIAFFVLRKKSLQPEPNVEISRKKQFILVSLITLIIGVYDGFYGPGTGTFLIIAYTSLVKMNVLTAGGNTKLANLASNISALVVFLSNGVVLIPLALVAACFSIAGNYVGAGLAIKNGTKFVRIIIILVLVLLFIKIIYEAVT